MSHDVFISFAFKDQKAAGCIRTYLEGSGIKCFMCTDLPAGTGYDEALGKAIREAKILALILSSNADNSHSVRNEVAIAKNRGKTIIPVRIEDFLPEKLEFSIATSLFFDAFPPPLEKHLPKLVKDIDTILRPLETSEPTGQPKSKADPTISPPKQPPVRPGEWREIDYEDLNDWVKERIKVLNSGKQLVARTFIYRKNRFTGKYERKLKTSKG
jgi:hypothetical protein